MTFRACKRFSFIERAFFGEPFGLDVVSPAQGDLDTSPVHWCRGDTIGTRPSRCAMDVNGDGPWPRDSDDKFACGHRHDATKPVDIAVRIGDAPYWQCSFARTGVRTANHRLFQTVRPERRNMSTLNICAGRSPSRHPRNNPSTGTATAGSSTTRSCLVGRFRVGRSIAAVIVSRAQRSRESQRRDSG